MSQAMTVFGGQLPDPKTLAAATQRYESEASSMGAVFLKFKEGYYSYGSDSTEPQEGSKWVVNPWSMTHGWILFDNKFEFVEQRSVVPAAESLPGKPENPSPEISKSGWQEQFSFSLMCLNGDDKGLEVLFNTSSTGGIKACKQLIAAFSVHVNNDPAGEQTPLPVIELLADSYYNKTYRRTVHFPVFKIVDFIGADDLQGLAAPAEEEKAEPQRKRREPVKTEAPVSTKRSRAAVSEPVTEVVEAEYDTYEEVLVPEPEVPRRRRSVV